MNKHLPTIILASQSPRRIELIKHVATDSMIAPNRNVEEIYPEDLPVRDVPEYLAKLKGEAYHDLLTDDNIIISADTVVLLDGEIIGKPGDRNKSIEMLRQISGKCHQVVTGVYLMQKKQSRYFSEKTYVFFAELTDEQIIYYVDNYHPFDKAGAYGIQDWIGYVGIKKIEGSYSNVVGLPVHRLMTELNSFISR
ncbi:Maf family nucleotide pyrophosphatase [Bacteroidales bacterium]|nr:Maf family nucleotide pyrophosphatase [Bacteroidales bacterium]